MAKPGPKGTWTKAEEDILRHEWLEKRTASGKIEKLFEGRHSRSAIMGKIKRLGLRREPLLPKKKISTAQFHLRPEQKERLTARIKAIRHAQKHHIAPPAKPLIDIGAQECRWPVEDISAGKVALFCAAPCTHGPYCALHHIMGHVSPKDMNIVGIPLDRHESTLVPDIPISGD